MKHQLHITNLAVSSQDTKPILSSITFTLKEGTISVLMGPNGSGKSTLVQTLLGNPTYKITEGTITMDQTSFSHLSIDERARLGLFVSIQYPPSIPGISIHQLLSLALDQHKRHTSPTILAKRIQEESEKLHIPKKLLYQDINDHLSGGEKKKLELLHMAILEPTFVVLDEPDSGLDVDGTNQLGSYLTTLPFKPGILLITHRPEFVHALLPETVLVIQNGTITKKGTYTLADEIAQKGYA